MTEFRWQSRGEGGRGERAEYLLDIGVDAYRIYEVTKYCIIQEDGGEETEVLNLC